MKREHRKQIKRDELLTGMEQTAVRVRARQREVRATLIGVAIVVVGVLGFTTFRDRRQASAERAFASAARTGQRNAACRTRSVRLSSAANTTSGHLVSRESVAIPGSGATAPPRSTTTAAVAPLTSRASPATEFIGSRTAVIMGAIAPSTSRASAVGGVTVSVCRASTPRWRPA